MAPFVDAREQLVVEILVGDLARSIEFYRRFGFELRRWAGGFVELAWEGCLFFLDERRDLPAPSSFPQANVRVMVPDVDRYWRLAGELGAPVVAPIGDRDYGLRDFTIADPDGFGLRFATRLPPGPVG